MKKHLTFIFFGIIVGAVLATMIMTVSILSLCIGNELFNITWLAETIFFWSATFSIIGWFFFTSCMYRYIYQETDQNQ